MSSPLPPVRVQVVTSSVADGDGYWQFQVDSVSCSGHAAAARAGASSRAELERHAEQHAVVAGVDLAVAGWSR